MTSTPDPPRLEPVEQRPAFDPEFDRPRVWTRRRVPRADLVPQEYQRLVANPLLAFAVFCAGLFSFGHMIPAGGFVPLFFGLLAVLALPVLLLQYHCLDCGRTGWMFRWRRHACEAVLLRQHTGRIRRFRGPTPTMQTLLWMYVFLSTVILGAIAWNSGR